MDLEKIRLENGKLPSYAWPGGYPLYYLDHQNSTLCPDCANKEQDLEQFKPASYGINYEDPSLYCDNCSKRIESAYAEDEAGQ